MYNGPNKIKHTVTLSSFRSTLAGVTVSTSNTRRDINAVNINISLYSILILFSKIFLPTL